MTKPSKKQPRKYVEYPASDLQKRSAEILNEVQHGLHPIVITRHDKPVVFIAPIALLEKLDPALLEVFEEEGTRLETMTREIRRSAPKPSDGPDGAKTVPGRTIRKPAR